MGSRKWWGLVALLAVLALAGCHKTAAPMKPPPQTPKAEYRRGLDYYFGHSVPQNYKKANYWCHEAAAQGYALAEYTIGFMYHYGYGAPQNYRKALSWYRKAAAQKDVFAENSIGYAYKKGQGVPRNYREALSWYRKAAAQKDAFAEHNIGGMYFSGDGVPRSYRKAGYWYGKAAEQGQADWQEFARHGNGVQQRYVGAYMWFVLANAAARPGSNIYQMAFDSVRLLSAQMPWISDSADIARAQSLAAAWAKAPGK